MCGFTQRILDFCCVSGLLEAALLPVVVAVFQMAKRASSASTSAEVDFSEGLPSLVPLDRPVATSARRLHERLLLSPSQMKAYRQWALARVSPSSKRREQDGEDAGPAVATAMREAFPAGFEVLVEERVELAAHAIEKGLRVKSADQRQPAVGIVICSSVLTMHLAERLDSLAGKRAGAAKREEDFRSEEIVKRLLTSPPCLVPLLLLRFLALPLGAVFLTLWLSSISASWISDSLRRGDLPENLQKLQCLAGSPPATSEKGARGERLAGLVSGEEKKGLLFC